MTTTGHPITSDILPDFNSLIQQKNGCHSTINIYDVTGRTVRIIEAREGMNEVHGLDSGIYLLEGQKVVIGR